MVSCEVSPSGSGTVLLLAGVGDRHDDLAGVGGDPQLRGPRDARLLAEGDDDLAAADEPVGRSAATRAARGLSFHGAGRQAVSGSPSTADQGWVSIRARGEPVGVRRRSWTRSGVPPMYRTTLSAASGAAGRSRGPGCPAAAGRRRSARRRSRRQPAVVALAADQRVGDHGRLRPGHPGCRPCRVGRSVTSPRSSSGEHGLGTAVHGDRRGQRRGPRLRRGVGDRVDLDRRRRPRPGPRRRPSRRASSAASDTGPKEATGVMPGRARAAPGAPAPHGSRPRRRCRGRCAAPGARSRRGPGTASGPRSPRPPRAAPRRRRACGCGPRA